jgi:ribonuclease PH
MHSGRRLDSNSHLEGLQYKLQHTFTASICHQSHFKTFIRIAISIINHGASLADAATLAGLLALLNATVQMGDLVVSCTVDLDERRFIQFLKSEVSVRVAILPSKEEIVETEVLGTVEPDTITQAVSVAITGCKDLAQSIKRVLGEQLAKK